MRLMRFSAAITASLGTLVLEACRPPVPNVPAPSASGGFVVTLGNDTVSAETFARTGNRIDGVVVRRVPRTAVVRYTMTLNANGLPSRIEYNTRLPDGRRLPNGAESIVVEFRGDSALTTIVRESTTVTRVAARNAYPEIDGSVFLYELPIKALRGMNQDSARFVAYAAGAPSGSSTPVARKSPNTYWLYSEGNPIEVISDDRGDVLSVDGTRTTFRITSRRQSDVDLAAITAGFSLREAIAGPVTVLSPRDTTRATVGGARLWVDYGRPAARGRRIFGPNGVLGDTLWRTGANQATQLHTDAPISIGGQTLPPGTYGLMTLAIPGRYHLIIYEGGRERLRVPLEAAEIAPSVERFTIAIDVRGERAGLLRLLWDTVELSVPFTVP